MELGDDLGRMLQPHNARKSMVANFSFLELECRSDCAWWTMAVALTTKIQEVQGGWSKMLRELLRMSLVGPSGMHTAGIPLMLQGEHIVIYAKVVCLLSDGDGLRQAMQWSGGWLPQTLLSPLELFDEGTPHGTDVRQVCRH